MDSKILFQINKLKKDKKLNFSSVLFTAPERIKDLENTIKNLPKKSAIIFRYYNLNQTKKQELAIKTKKLCKKLGHKFIIAKDLKLAKKLNPDGIHFSDRDKISLRQINKKHPKLIKTFACHSQNSITKAQKSNSDLLLLSPIFPTKTHQDATPLGLLTLRKSINQSQKPIFALGGITKNNITSLLKTTPQGLAAINLFTLPQQKPIKGGKGLQPQKNKKPPIHPHPSHTHQKQKTHQ